MKIDQCMAELACLYILHKSSEKENSLFFLVTVYNYCYHVLVMFVFVLKLLVLCNGDMYLSWSKQYLSLDEQFDGN